MSCFHFYFLIFITPLITWFHTHVSVCFLVSGCTEWILYVFPEKSMENDEFPPADGVDRCRTVLVGQCRCSVLHIWDQPNVQPTCTGTSRKGIWSGDKMVRRCFFLFPFFNLMDSDSENETSPPALLGVGHHFPHSLPPGVSLSILLHQGGPQDCRILYSAHLPCCSLQPSPNLR